MEWLSQNSEALGSIAIYTVLYLLFAWARKDVDALFGKLGEDKDGLLRNIQNTVALIFETLKSSFLSIDDFVDEKILDNFKKVLESAALELGRFTDFLVNHQKSVISEVVSLGTGKPTWGVIGASLQFVFLFLFFYADVSQAFNSYSALRPFFTTNIPPLFRNLTIPLIISSAGTMVGLGMVLSDLLGVSHFAPWEVIISKFGVKIRNKLITLVIITALTSLVLSLTIGASRLGAFVDLSPDIVDDLNLIAGVAQILILGPMLMTTLLLLWGLLGLTIIYLIMVGVLILLAKTVQLLLNLVGAASIAGGTVVSAIVRFMAFLVNIISLVLVSIVTLSISALEVIHWFINLLAFPLRKLLFHNA